MLKLNYYFHVLLTSKYSIVIKLAILLGIYLLFAIDNSIDTAQCMPTNKKKLERALAEIEQLKQENHLYKTLAQQRTFEYEQDPKYQEFMNIDYTLYPVQHEYKLADGRIVRHAEGKPFEIIDRLNNIPERTSEFDYIQVRPSKGIWSFQDTYYPPHHPINGNKPEGEFVREHNPVYFEYNDIPRALRLCNIL